MTPEVIGTLVDKGITFFAGLFFTLLGFRIIGRKKGESSSYDAYMDKFGWLFRGCGPLLMVIAVVLAAVNLSPH